MAAETLLALWTVVSMKEDWSAVFASASGQRHES